MPAGLLAQGSSQDLIRQSIEDLMNVEVTTASKKEQKLSQTAAAVYVVSQEDIRRSGATSIPEALRMVPGVNVARFNSSQWAVSARGFNGKFSGKLLVLIDGRSVYTPLYSGVYWDVQDTMIEDIERIEVIRGPGATLWGANAVNGVINIITKHTKDTHGTLISSGGGSEERGFAGARQGGKLGSKSHFRVYSKYFNRGPSADASGGDAGDEWSALRSGFRVDSEPSSRDSLTVQGDVYRVEEDGVTSVASLSPPFAKRLANAGILNGGNLLGRWNRAFSGGSETTLQVYWDRTARADSFFGQNTNILDLDFEHRTPLTGRQELVWGLGFRQIGLETRGSFVISFNPAERTNRVGSAFVQDEIAVVRDRFFITMGSKFEHNDYSGVEVQPSIRLLWTPTERHSVWAAVSRAVRTPTPASTDLRVNAAVFPGNNRTLNLLSIFGDPAAQSEKLLAYEAGYRVQPTRKVSLDLASFRNRYDDLLTIVSDRPFLETEPQPAHMVIPQRLKGGRDGSTYGLEAAANWNTTSYWKWTAGYTWQRMRLKPAIGGTRSFDSPSHQWQARSSLNLPHRAELDTTLYYTDALRDVKVPSYFRLDTRLGWRLSPSVSLSVTLQNLLDNRHPEFNETDGGVQTTQIRRGAYAKLTWAF